MNIAVVEQRATGIKASLKTVQPDGWTFHRENLQGAITGTLSILALIYGPRSLQVAQFQAGLKLGSSPSDVYVDKYEHRIADGVFSALDSAIADSKAGVVQSERVRGKGEVLGDFVTASRNALEQHSVEAERVAAVLVAAALEEVLKQIGENLDIDVYDRDMRGVIQKLKDADVLVGPQAGLALGYSQFRDKAFHGQFDQIDRGTTESALAARGENVVSHAATAGSRSR
jgi:hypothetical protein